jgi:hypothetical protein
MDTKFGAVVFAGVVGAVLMIGGARASVDDVEVSGGDDYYSKDDKSGTEFEGDKDKDDAEIESGYGKTITDEDRDEGYTGSGYEKTITDEDRAEGYTGKAKYVAEYGTYNGDFVNGKAEGHGKFEFSNGESYEGAYKNNLADGKGVYTYPDGRKLEGVFCNDKFIGEGTDKDRYGNEPCKGIRNDRNYVSDATASDEITEKSSDSLSDIPDEPIPSSSLSDTPDEPITSSSLSSDIPDEPIPSSSLSMLDDMFDMPE